LVDEAIDQYPHLLSRAPDAFYPAALPNIDQPVVLIKARLKPMQYWPGLIDGFVANTGLDIALRFDACLAGPGPRSRGVRECPVRSDYSESAAFRWSP